MDNFNNNGVPNTPLDGNTSTPNNDYNSMQPQSNTVVNENVQPDLSIPQVVETPVVEEQPPVQQTPTIGSTGPNEQGIAMENLVQSMENSVPEVTPDPVVQAPVQEEVVAPTMDSAPVEFETTPIMETPPMTDPMAQPLENSMPTMQPIEPTTMENQAFNPAPVDETTDIGTTTMQTDSMNTLDGVDSQPAFAPNQAEVVANTPDMSTNLSQPFSAPQEAPQEPTVQPNDEVVSTLGESKEEGKDSSVVIVVLVVIIVLLLAGIGYFGYQIFLG